MGDGGLTIAAGICVLAFFAIAAILVAVSTWKAAAGAGGQGIFRAKEGVGGNGKINYHGRRWSHACQCES